jgi:hypothetical protein
MLTHISFMLAFGIGISKLDSGICICLRFHSTIILEKTGYDEQFIESQTTPTQGLNITSSLIQSECVASLQGSIALYSLPIVLFTRNNCQVVNNEKTHIVTGHYQPLDALVEKQMLSERFLIVYLDD